MHPDEIDAGHRRVNAVDAPETAGDQDALEAAESEVKLSDDDTDIFAGAAEVDTDPGDLAADVDAVDDVEPLPAKSDVMRPAETLGVEPQAEVSPIYGLRDASSSPELPLSDLSRRRLDAALLFLLLAAAVCDFGHAPAVARGTLTFGAALLVPGAAVLRRAKLLSLLHATAVVAGVSLAIDAAVSVVLVAVRWWHPVPAAVAIGVVSGAVLAWDMRRRRDPTPLADRSPEDRTPGLEALQRALLRPSVPLLVVGVGMWVAALTMTDGNRIDASGLLDALPPVWYVGLGIVVLAVVVETWSRALNPIVVAAGLCATVAILYATIPLLEAMPQYSWVYKHIGVTRLIMSTGQVHPNVDIYNRWPAFFASAAAFSRITGIDPLSYAKWFEPVFSLVEMTVVAAIARYVSGSARVASLAGLLWLAINWVGQDYFSPQAFAYILGLVVMLVVLFAVPATGRLQRRLVRLGRLILRKRQEMGPLTAINPWHRLRCAAVALALTAVIVATHQLTPYLLIAQVCVLACFGLRPIWLPAAMLVLAVAYFGENFSFVNAHYGFLSGLDPFKNAAVASGVGITRPWLYQNVGRLLTVSALGLGSISALRIARRGQVTIAVTLLALAVIPFSLILVSSYGGEGILRAALFSSPWTAVLTAWGLVTLPRWMRFSVSGIVSIGLIGLFVISMMSNATSNVIPPSEVVASQYFYAHAPAGSVLMEADANFPSEVGARYYLMADAASDAPDVLSYPWANPDKLGRRTLPKLELELTELSLTPFVAFSTSGYRDATYDHLVAPGGLEKLERAVAASSLFHIWYRNASTRIYELGG